MERVPSYLLLVLEQCILLMERTGIQRPIHLQDISFIQIPELMQMVNFGQLRKVQEVADHG